MDEKTKVLFNSSTETGSSNPSITDMTSKSKPQNFTRAKQQLKGLYQCIYDCGKTFRSRKEAERHQNCPKRIDCENYLHAMCLYHSYKPRSATLREWTEEDAQRLRSVLEGLPMISKEEFMAKFLNESIPQMTETEDQIEDRQDDSDDWI